MKKDKPAPTHGVFDALAELLQAFDAVTAAFEARLGHLRQQALQQCEANVRAARQRLATRSFDDLLLDLHAALAARGRTAHLIGGADVAAELDAKRAIDQGSRLAARL